MPSESLSQLLNFNIDRYLNPFIPRNYIYLLPKPISHFLGYREKPHKEPPAVVQWLLTIVSTIGGLLAIGAVLNYAPSIQSWNPPIMIASLGAAAILEYNAIRSPFAQPRNAIIGHTLAAIVAVGVAKLFMLAPGFYDDYMWIASIIACAAASVLMSMTNTLYPPGGATAMLACVDKQIVELGWMFPPLILISMALMIAVALLLNNTLRHFPVFWWTPDKVGAKLYREEKKEQEEKAQDKNEPDDRHVDDSDVEKGVLPPSLEVKEIYDSDATDSDATDSEHTLAREPSRDIEILPGLEAVHVSPYMIRMPPQLQLTDAESEMLRGLMVRLRTSTEHMYT